MPQPRTAWAALVAQPTTTIPKRLHDRAFAVAQVYNVSSGKSLPEWLSEGKKKALQKNEEYRRRIELIQDFSFPSACQRIRVTPDEQYIFTSGYHPPMVRAARLPHPVPVPPGLQLLQGSSLLPWASTSACLAIVAACLAISVAACLAISVAAYLAILTAVAACHGVHMAAAACPLRANTQLLLLLRALRRSRCLTSTTCR
jgi:hypothetical protein